MLQVPLGFSTPPKEKRYPVSWELRKSAWPKPSNLPYPHVYTPTLTLIALHTHDTSLLPYPFGVNEGFWGS